MRRHNMRIRNITILISIFSIVDCSSRYSVEILNTQSTSWKGWVKNSGNYDGWRTQNIPPNGQLVYGICKMQEVVQDYWLRSPFIIRDDAFSVTIEISFTMRSCKSFPEPIRNCKEAMHLMAYETDSPSDVPSSWNDRIYITLDVVSPNNKWKYIGQNDSIVNVKTYYLWPRKAGFFLALRDTGACSMVKLIRVYYRVHSEIRRFFTKYLLTGDNNKYQEVKGVCVYDAELVSAEKQPILVCQDDERCLISDALFCHCKPGYTPLYSKVECRKCSRYTYKPFSGIEKCMACPELTYSHTGAHHCLCKRENFPIKSARDQLLCKVRSSLPELQIGFLRHFRYVTLNVGK